MLRPELGLNAGSCALIAARAWGSSSCKLAVATPPVRAFCFGFEGSFPHSVSQVSRQFFAIFLLSTEAQGTAARTAASAACWRDSMSTLDLRAGTTSPRRSPDPRMALPSLRFAPARAPSETGTQVNRVAPARGNNLPTSLREGFAACKCCQHSLARRPSSSPKTTASSSLKKASAVPSHMLPVRFFIYLTTSAAHLGKTWYALEPCGCVRNTHCSQMVAGYFEFGRGRSSELTGWPGSGLYSPQQADC